MRNKLIFLAGLGVGYVLGARAGRQRYEQLMQTARRIKEHPTVQETAGLIQAQAGSLATSAKDLVTNKAGNTRLGNKLSDLLSDYRSDHPQSAASSAGPNSIR